MHKSKFSGLIIFLIILVIATIIRIPAILNNNFPFTYDHGLTFLEIRDIVFGNKLRLIGPEGGIKGIFFGPTWYYLIAFPFWFLKGDPRSGALISLVLNLGCIPLAWFIGKKINYKIGLIFTLFFAFSSFMISRSSNAFVVDTFPFINLLALWLLISSNIYLNLYLIVFLASLSFHFEPVVALGFNLAIFYILYPKIKNLNLIKIFILILIWLLPFFPQILFDLRHNFLQTHAVISALFKAGKDLGGNLPLWERVIDRPIILIKHFYNVMGNNKLWFTIISLIYFIIGIKTSINSANKKIKLIATYSLIFLLVPFLYYVLLFPPGIKGWYYTSFFNAYIIFISFGLIYEYKNKIFQHLSFLIIILFLFINIEPFNNFYSWKNSLPSQDPSSVKNELAVIEWIYQDAHKTPFVIYTYSPAVYDYPYQYLIWWYAKKNKLPFPKDFGYRPKTIDYVPNKLSYVPNPETNEEFITYLIIHSYSTSTQFWPLEEFLQPYQNIPLIEEKIFDGGIKIQKRKVT